MCTMKALSLLVLILIYMGRDAHAFQSPDVMVDSKINHDWSTILVSRVRKLLSNFKMSDPFHYVSNEIYVFDQMSLESLIPDHSRNLLLDLNRISGLDIVQGHPKVELQGFFYEVKNLKADVMTGKEDTDALNLTATLNASEFYFSTDKLSVSVIVKAGDKSISLVRIDVIAPSISAKAHDLINFTANLRVFNAKNDGNDVHKFEILSTDFSKFLTQLNSHPENIDFEYDRLDIKCSQLKIGPKTIKVNLDEVKAYIEANREGLKGLLLAKAAAKMAQDLPEAVHKLADKIVLPKNRWINAKAIKVHTRIDQFKNPQGHGNFGVHLPLNFCSHTHFDTYGDACLEKNPGNKIKSRITMAMHSASVKNIQTMIENGQANIVASISEDLFTKLLNTTYEAGTWNNFLKKAKVFLGPIPIAI